MEVIVTDHHQAGEELPDCPILHPEVSGYPFAALCGTAVAWKLALVRSERRSRETDRRRRTSTSSRWRPSPTSCR